MGIAEELGVVIFIVHPTGLRIPGVLSRVKHLVEDNLNAVHMEARVESLESDYAVEPSWLTLIILAPESLSKPFQSDEGGIQKVHAPPKPASPLRVFLLYCPQMVIKFPADLPKQGQTWCDKNIAKCK
jgi:hypothetical protein